MFSDMTTLDNYNGQVPSSDLLLFRTEFTKQGIIMGRAGLDPAESN